MEIAVLLFIFGACCIRRAMRQDGEDAVDYARKSARTGLWQKVLGLWNNCPEPADSETSGSQKDMESLQIRQKSIKDSGRMETHLSYQQKGRTVSVKCQDTMTLQFAGFAIKLEPAGIKVQEVSKKAGGEVLPFPPVEPDGNGREAHKARPNRDQRGKAGNRGMRQEVDEAAGEKWQF
jgi:hypothetical protein